MLVMVEYFLTHVDSGSSRGQEIGTIPIPISWYTMANGIVCLNHFLISRDG